MTMANMPDGLDAVLSRESRESAAAARDEAAARRDEVAADRDLAANERDRRADLRNVASRSLDSDTDILGVAQDGGASGRDRDDDGWDREDDGRDREDASRDRKDAGRDRQDAERDRDRAEEELQALTYDELTRTRRRGPGLHDLQLEIERAQRTRQQLAVAYMDVDGLKALNDKEGHGAGDRLLKRITAAARASMRRYDSIVRLGGDEFLCILPGAGIGGARSALDHVRDTIAGSVGCGSISAGVAELEPQDSWEDLIARADADLIAGRAQHAAVGGR